MIRTATKSRKTRGTFKVHVSPKKRAAAASPLATTRAQLLKRFKRLKANSKRRVRRLSQVLLGSGRSFAGHVVIPPREVASRTDALRLKDIQKELKTGKAAVYWVDGSERHGYLGAGVVWEEGNITRARFHLLGRNTVGYSGDAELFAIAAAMRKAKLTVRNGNGAQLVRIYSDAREVLLGLRSGRHPWIGPLQDKTTVLRQLYDNVDWLVSHNVRVEVIWVKGHSGSEGNQIADTAARKAVTAQIASCRLNDPGITAQQDITKRCRRFGPDWSAEWLYRMHRQQLISAFRGPNIKSTKLAEVSKLLEICESIDIPTADPASESEANSEDDLADMSGAVGHRKNANSDNIGIAIKTDHAARPSASRSFPRQKSELPGRHASPLRVQKGVEDTRAHRAARSVQTRSGGARAERTRCIPSLLIWGSATVQCATRLRKRSRLDNIEQ